MGESVGGTRASASASANGHGLGRRGGGRRGPRAPWPMGVEGPRACRSPGTAPAGGSLAGRRHGGPPWPRPRRAQRPVSAANAAGARRHVRAPPTGRGGAATVGRWTPPRVAPPYCHGCGGARWPVVATVPAVVIGVAGAALVAVGLGGAAPPPPGAACTGGTGRAPGARRAARGNKKKTPGRLIAKDGAHNARSSKKKIQGDPAWGRRPARRPRRASAGARPHRRPNGTPPAGPPTRHPPATSAGGAAAAAAAAVRRRRGARATGGPPPHATKKERETRTGAGAHTPHAHPHGKKGKKKKNTTQRPPPRRRGSTVEKHQPTGRADRGPRAPPRGPLTWVGSPRPPPPPPP